MVAEKLFSSVFVFFFSSVGGHHGTEMNSSRCDLELNDIYSMWAFPFRCANRAAWRCTVIYLLPICGVRFSVILSLLLLFSFMAMCCLSKAVRRSGRRYAIL
jgi:hypothetical protein